MGGWGIGVGGRLAYFALCNTYISYNKLENIFVTFNFIFSLSLTRPCEYIFILYHYFLHVINIIYLQTFYDIPFTCNV